MKIDGFSVRGIFPRGPAKTRPFRRTAEGGGAAVGVLEREDHEKIGFQSTVFDFQCRLIVLRAGPSGGPQKGAVSESEFATMSVIKMLAASQVAGRAGAGKRGEGLE